MTATLDEAVRKFEVERRIAELASGLAMQVLQSDMYKADADVRESVDAILAEVRWLKEGRE